MKSREISVEKGNVYNKVFTRETNLLLFCGTNFYQHKHPNNDSVVSASNAQEV